MRNLATFTVTVLAAAAMQAGAAWAQDDAALARTGLFVRDRNVAVTERPKPEYRALPIPVDGLLLTPTITGSMEYNDNIYAVNTGQTSDEIFRIQPGLVLASNWGRNAVSAFARASANEYVNHTTESTTDWSTGINGRLDLQHDWGVAAGAAYQELTEPRSSSGSPTDITSPIRYYLSDNYVESTKEFDRFRFTARGGFQDYTYINAHTPQGGVVYQEDRDEGIVSGAFKAEYAVLPDTSVFADVVLNHRDFYNRLSFEPSRNSGGYEATVGANFDLTHLLRGEIYIGYLEQDYRSPDYKGVGGLALRGVLYYFPTQLTTITASGARTVQDSDILGAGPYLSSNYTAQLDHELLRNLILSGSFTIGNDVYQGYDRTDNRYIVTAGGTYLLTRTIGLNLKYSHFIQDSSGAERGPNFDINSVILSLAYQFGG